MQGKQYSIWVLEYSHVYTQPVGSVLGGQFNKGICDLAFTYTLIKSKDHTIMIDTGTNGYDAESLKFHERDGLKHWQPPEKILGKVGVKPEEVDTVLLTHAHFDHMDNLAAFPNAEFYIQEKELMGWVWAMTREKRFRFPLLALKTQDVFDALKLAVDGKMHLVDGEVKDILPGIDLYPAYNGHTFASQIIAVHSGEDTLAFVGDVLYLRENIAGLGGSGQYVPVGMGTGDPYSQMKTYEDIIRMTGGKMENIIIGHSPEIYEMFPSKTYDDHLSVAEIVLADGESSRL